MEGILFLLYLVPFVISLYSSWSVRINGSDNAYHLLMIHAIKANGNRFITTMPYFIGKNRHSYPQLLHWVFSYLSEEKLLRYARFTGAVGHMLSGIALYIFVINIYPLLVANGIEIPRLTFFGLVAMVYVIAPINYDLFNAKNIGFSARGFGLFLGQSITYLSIFYLLESNLYYLAAAGFLTYLVFLSSVFATQYLILYTIIASLVFKDIYLLLPFLIGLVLFFVFHCRVALVYFKGQYTHKKLYALYLAKIFILKNRPSVWRDLVYDFWIKIFGIFKKSESVGSVIQYIMTNPVVNLLIGVPFIFLLYKAFVVDSLDLVSEILLTHIYIVLGMFLLTSFRATRFLGEPERYFEFAIGVLAVLLSILVYPFYVVMILLGVFCLILILARIYLVKRMMARISTTTSSGNVEKGSVARGLLLQPFLQELDQRSIETKKLKVLSNLAEVTKQVLSDKYQTFRHPLFQEYIGRFHFNDLYRDSYFMMDLEVIKEVIKEFSIDILIYGVNEKEGNSWESLQSDYDCELIYHNDAFKVFKFRNYSSSQTN